MAALCPGVQYGLSSQGNFGENKDLIFVKLTDSAYRAIEEYIRNKNKFNQNPSIQFLGNEGQLSFPSDHGSNGCASFNFSVSSTADMEGPGGSFECVQQCGPPRGALEGLGAMSHKMRIHANDDVYETTRHRMTVAEENHKNKCTREIKPNQTNIGRKIKKATPSRSIPIPKREPLSSVRESLSSSKPSYQSSNISSKPTVHSSNGLGNGLGSNHVTSSRPQNKPSREADIMRRPIKERLLHLLALRPYKKPELIERINRDGREKNVLTTVLKQIAFMQGNTYHLHQHMWSDVNDDWPFYTEQERQLLKRRKPQNLTPPGSSDGGSSGSGQSPTSTHPGSPPPPVTSSVKRPGYYDGADGLPTKRPRISHYRKPEPSYIRPAESNTQRRPPTDSRDASNMNPRSREPSVGGGGPPDRGGGGPGGGGGGNNSTTLNGGYAGTNANGNSYTSSSSTIINNDKRHYSDEENDIANRKRACDSHSLSYNVNREKTFKENSICSSPNKTPTSQDTESRNNSNKDLWGDRTAAAAVVNRCRPVESDSRDRDCSNRGERERTGGSASERDRGEKERGERERGEKERSDRERERGEKERSDRERERGEKERSDRERERGEKERSDRERERGEKERSDRERERGEKERSDRERERGERERGDRERSERERGERERSERERGERERNERERNERERNERERGERERGDRERERGDRNASDRDRGVVDRSDKERMRWNKVSSTTHNGTNVTRASPDSQADRIMTVDPGPPPTVESKSEFPDYLTEYTTIKNVEQRRRYKSDFNADYAEYRDLHAVVERVSRRFAQLEERLKQEDQSSQGYKEIKKQIVRDYKENQRDSEYQKAKRRFQYLHDKLSHIKRLVLEYDQSTEAQGNHCDRY